MISLAAVYKTDLKVDEIEVRKVNEKEAYYSNLWVKR